MFHLTEKQNRDIQKIRARAKELGVRVFFRKTKTKDNDGCYVYDDKIINIFYTNKSRAKSIIIALIHELCHAEGHAKYGNCNLIKMAFRDVDLDSSQWSKKTRRAFFNLEKRDILRMVSVYKRLKLSSVSRHEVQAAQIFDLDMYRGFFLTGRYPSVSKRGKILKNISILSKVGSRA